jgi:hypothetical protein
MTLKIIANRVESRCKIVLRLIVDITTPTANNYQSKISKRIHGKNKRKNSNEMRSKTNKDDQ